jgi:CBS domain-containing protein
MLGIRDGRNAIYIRGRLAIEVKGKDIMIGNFACCTPEHTARQAAEMMVRNDCGEIAIVESVENLKQLALSQTATLRGV